MQNRLMLSVLAVVILAGAVATQAPVGRVKGTVERSGTAVAGVTVAIESRAHSTYGDTTATDGDGAFTFEDVPVGQFVVKAHDGEGNLLATSEGVLDKAGDVVTLLLQADR